ncbi:MAG: DUF134 domain-containing protein [Campylobacteraceae bacterium]|nr:DUF134 domain-containing protein [Campylobacteraceae bacterium]
MGRQKIERKYSFKPNFTLFKPTKPNGEIELNADEIEAIYLMDYEDLYQEDAALEMEISRPTFSRIIKSARTKIATALVRGYTLQIVDAKDKFIIAFSIPELNENSNHFDMTTRHKQIVLVHLNNQKVIDTQLIPNPLFDQSTLATKVLPALLKANDVNYWLSSEIDAKLKDALLARGIFSKRVVSLDNMEDIPPLFCKL